MSLSAHRAAAAASSAEIENDAQEGSLEGAAGGPRGSDSSAKTKKPKDSAFKQQRLPAWQPILTAGTVLPTFFVIGFAFIPIGIGMLWFSDHVNEEKWDYTECKSLENPNSSCAELVVNSTDPLCRCTVEFTLDADWEGNVYVYYGLTNFYQNHRRYVKSRDDSQLLGALSHTPSPDCEPFDKNAATGVVYVPCGAVANSLFSDSITLHRADEANNFSEVKLVRKGIAWESDKKYKFQNPKGSGNQSLQELFQNYSKPRDWHKDIWELDPLDPDNNGLQNEDLIVWMRTAALPNFRKLYRKLNHTVTGFEGKMPKGRYRWDIDYRFRVKQFSGKKSIILSTTSILGGKNPFLGIAYITVGSICMLMGVVFLFIHIKCGKQLSADGAQLKTISSYNTD